MYNIRMWSKASCTCKAMLNCKTSGSGLDRQLLTHRPISIYNADFSSKQCLLTRHPARSKHIITWKATSPAQINAYLQNVRFRPKINYLQAVQFRRKTSYSDLKQTCLQCITYLQNGTSLNHYLLTNYGKFQITISAKTPQTPQI
jgi:hypothetical protein